MKLFYKFGYLVLGTLFVYCFLTPYALLKEAVSTLVQGFKDRIGSSYDIEPIISILSALVGFTCGILIGLTANTKPH